MCACAIHSNIFAFISVRDASAYDGSIYMYYVPISGFPIPIQLYVTVWTPSVCVKFRAMHHLIASTCRQIVKRKEGTDIRWVSMRTMNDNFEHHLQVEVEWTAIQNKIIIWQRKTLVNVPFFHVWYHQKIDRFSCCCWCCGYRLFLFRFELTRAGCHHYCGCRCDSFPCIFYSQIIFRQMTLCRKRRLHVLR